MKKTHFRSVKSHIVQILLAVCITFGGFLPIEQIQAQQKNSVSGVVKDTRGIPLVGAPVSVKGQKTGTMTDQEGRFFINLPTSKGILQFSYVGYISKEIPVLASANSLEIILDESEKALDEVVVIGYGNIKKSDLTGSIASVKGGELTKTSTSSITQALQGKLAGVQIVENSGTPGGDVSILIRGQGTINDASPLYVVDGVPINAGIGNLSPNNIESIDVLKDASATAIYGSRGANGVVIITTRKAREGRSEINLDYSFGIQKSANMFEMLDASQFATLHNDMRTHANMPLNPLFSNPSSLGVGTNWISPLFETAPMQKVTTSFSGGNKKINHFTSLGYYKQEGILQNTGYERINLQSNVTSNLTDNIKLSANVSLSSEDRQNQPVYTVLANAMRMLPSITIYDEEGNYNGPTGSAELNGSAINPFGIINEQSYRSKYLRMLSNASLDWSIIKGLTFKTTGGYEGGFEYNNNLVPKYKWGNQQQENTTQLLSSSYETLYLWDNTLSYDRVVGKHKFNAMIGTSFQNYKKEWMSASGSGRASEMTTELDNSLKATDVGGNSYKWAIMSYMARAHYSYADRYLLTATFRCDGSSKFGKNNRFGYFPSFSGAWNLTNESFLKNTQKLSMLKLRVGYGQTGNQNIGAYAFADKLEVNGVYNFGSQRGFESSTVSLIYPYILANPDIKWETVEQYNIGLDIAFFNGRLSSNIDLYLKNTFDMLTRRPVPQTSGSGLEKDQWPPVNIGKVRNQGLEFTVNTQNFVGKFNWTTSLNLFFNKNKVVKLGGKNNDILSGVSLIREGYPIGSFYGYQMGGIYQTLDEVFNGTKMENRANSKENHNSAINTSPGDIYFVNADGSNDIIDEKDRKIIGNPIPWFTFGLTNNLSYKNFDLSFFFQGVYGNENYNAVRVDHEGMSSTYNQFISTLTHWQGEGSSNVMPRAIYADPNNNNRASTRWIENGAYLRLKNLTFGYTFKQNALKRAKIRSIRLYTSMDNLFTITKYSGLNPEVGFGGIDGGIYPIARNYMFGVSLAF